MICNKTITVLAPATLMVSFMLGLQAPRAAEKPTPIKKINGPLFPFQENGMWGLIDQTGDVVYKPQFSTKLHEPKFVNGYALLSFQDQLMWISERGEVVVPEEKVSVAGIFSDGLFRVNVGQRIRMGDILANAGLWGFVDQRGKMAIPAKFPDVSEFSHGLARAGHRAEGERRLKWGYINNKGEWVIQPKYLQARSFFEGLAFVGLAVPGERFVKQAVLDTMGRMVVQPQFDQAGSFSNGCAPVKKGDKWAYIDKMGRPICEFQYEAAEPIKDGLGLVWKWDKNKKGQIVNGRCGFINIKGELVTELKYTAGYSHSDGMAVVQVGDKFGYVDATGKLAITPKFDSAGPFSEGLAAVQVDGKTGYVNKQGELVIQPEFDYGLQFENGVARVFLDRKNRKYGYINKSGKLLRSYQLQPRRNSF